MSKKPLHTNFRNRVLEVCDEPISPALSALFRHEPEWKHRTYADFFSEIKKRVTGAHIHDREPPSFFNYPKEIESLGFLLDSILALHKKESALNFNTSSFAHHMGGIDHAASYYQEQLKQTEFKLDVLDKSQNTPETYYIRQHNNAYVIGMGPTTLVTREPWQIMFLKELNAAQLKSDGSGIESIKQRLEKNREDYKFVLSCFEPLKRALTPLLEDIGKPRYPGPYAHVTSPRDVTTLLTPHNLAATINAMRFSEVIDMATKRLAVLDNPHTEISAAEALIVGLGDMLASYDNVSPERTFLENLGTAFLHAEQSRLDRPDIECIKASPAKLRTFVETFKTVRSARAGNMSADMEYQADTRIIAAAIIYLADTMEPIAEQAKRTIFIQK